MGVNIIIPTQLMGPVPSLIFASCPMLLTILIHLLVKAHSCHKLKRITFEFILLNMQLFM